MNTSENYITLEIQLSEHTFNRLEKFRDQRKISINDALIYVLVRGFTSIEEGAESVDTDNEDRDYRAMYMQNEAELGVLRYKIFTQLESNRNWSLSSGAIENENVALKGLVNRLREEIVSLQAEMNAANESKKGV